MADCRVAADPRNSDGAPTTSDPVDGVLDGLRHVGVDPSQMSLFCHGTTVATNALITRRRGGGIQDYRIFMDLTLLFAG